MIKPLLTFTLITLLSLTAKSQSENFGAIKFDLGLGYASPTRTTNSSGGLSITGHLHYRLTDELAIGLRSEAALLGYNYTEVDASGSSYSNSQIAILNSYSLTGEYYLSNGWFRPFIGAGAGVFTQSSIVITTADDSETADLTLQKSKIGAFPEVGFETGHFRVSADYNFLPNKAGYWGVKAGFFFGGGRKSSDSGDGTGLSTSRRRSTWEGTP